MDKLYAWRIKDSPSESSKTWSPEGRQRRGRPEVKWQKEDERLMKQRNLTSEDAINGKV
jgi:hypothetical protein